MNQLPTPWIELSSEASDNTQSRNKNGKDCYHALFTARIDIKPFDYLENLKWGFSSESMLLGAVTRQRLFIEAQQLIDDLSESEPLNRRTLAFRCLRIPSSSELQLSILGKISGTNSDDACSEALEFWQEILSIFPYDYALVPAKTRDEFMKFSGQSFLSEGLSSLSVSEISRFEGILTNNPTSLYLLGRWHSTSTANEQIWRVLASYNKPLLLSILLRPTILFDYEKLAIAEMSKSVQTIFDEDPTPFVQRESKWVKDTYVARLNQLRYPFLAQVHLIGHGEIPEYLPRVIGSALVQSNENLLIEPRYQIKKIFNNASFSSLIQKISWLEPDLTTTLSDPKYSRMRYLIDATEAETLFHFPFPPKIGIPNVSFTTAKTF